MPFTLLQRPCTIRGDIAHLGYVWLVGKSVNEFLERSVEDAIVGNSSEGQAARFPSRYGRRQFYSYNRFTYCEVRGIRLGSGATTDPTTLRPRAAGINGGDAQKIGRMSNAKPF